MMLKKFLHFFCLLIVVLILPACNNAKPVVVKTSTISFDTTIDLEISGRDATQAQKIIFAELERLHNIFNRYDENSDVSKINRAGKTGATVSPDITTVINTIKAQPKEIRQVFALSSGPLVDLWNIKDEANWRLPALEQIQSAKTLINDDWILIDGDKVSLQLDNMSLDFGAVAKGYAVEQAMEKVAHLKLDYILLNAGGNVRIVGERPNRKNWRIGVQNPRQSDKISGVLNLLAGESAQTSGDYQRFIEFESKRYCHIIDLRTGYPVDNEIASVTITNNDSLLGDILSTSVFILGEASGKQLLENYYPTSFAVFIDKNLQITTNKENNNVFESR